MTFEVEHREAADIPQSIYMNGKLAEEVDDGRSTWGQCVPQHERCHDDGEKLLSENRDPHFKQMGELDLHLMRNNISDYSTSA